MPGALQDEIEDDMNVETKKFSWLYSFYSWPNALFTIIGGYLVDRYFGINLGAVIFACFTTTGQLIIACGALTNHFWLMCFGRFVFAIGGENLSTTTELLVIKWFSGRVGRLTLHNLIVSYQAYGIKHFSFVWKMVAPIDHNVRRFCNRGL